jgi:hypothetical protein
MNDLVFLLNPLFKTGPEHRQPEEEEPEQKVNIGVALEKLFTVALCRQTPNRLYVFGDNDVKRGTGGQAQIRGEPNAIGVPTKKDIKGAATDYYTDAEYDANVIKIENALQVVEQKLYHGKYTLLILPTDGLGTGLADLKRKAPRTFAYLQARITSLSDGNNSYRYVPIANRAPIHIP